MYDSAGMSVSKVGVGAGVAAAFGCGFGVVCRFCCAVPVRVNRSSKMIIAGYLCFMGVLSFSSRLISSNTIPAIRDSFPSFSDAFAAACLCVFASLRLCVKSLQFFRRNFHAKAQRRKGAKKSREYFGIKMLAGVAQKSRKK